MDIRIHVEEKKSCRCVYIPICHTSHPNHIEEHEGRRTLFITEHDFAETVGATLQFWSSATSSHVGTSAVEIMKVVKLSEKPFDRTKRPLVAIPLDSRCIIRHVHDGLIVWIPVFQYISCALGHLARTKILHLDQYHKAGHHLDKVFSRAWPEKIAELKTKSL